MTSFVLKIIAIVAMLFDHLGYVLNSCGFINDQLLLSFTVVGRLAFPLFCFLLVESFYFTKDRNRHLLQIGLLFLVSEIFFDMALILEAPLRFSFDALRVQNTCLTLFLGFLMLKIENADFSVLLKKMYINDFFNKMFLKCIKIVIIGFFSLLAILLKSDYVWRGIILIAILNFARNNKHRNLCQAFALAFFVFSMGVSIPLYISVFYTLVPICIAQRKQSNNVIKGRFSEVLTCDISRKICRYFYPLHLVLFTIFRIIVSCI